MATDALKSFVLSDPVVIKHLPVRIQCSLCLSENYCFFLANSCLFQVSSKGPVTFGMQKGPTGVFKSVLDTSRTDGKHRDEIFVDVVERLTCVFHASGYMQSAQIDGAIQV